MKPILFNSPMTQAIHEDRKTETRRVVKPQPPATSVVRKRGGSWDWSFWADCDMGHLIQPPYHSGDILWVRETWKPVSATVDFWEMGGPTAIDDGFGYKYKADGKIIWRGDFKPQNDKFHTTEIRCGEKWRPSIHMPKEAARLFLRVKAVKVERLQDIGDCTKEGVPQGTHATAHMNDYDERCFFIRLWDSTIKPADLPLYGWEANPWVWAIKFERISKEAAQREEGQDAKSAPSAAQDITTL